MIFISKRKTRVIKSEMQKEDVEFEKKEIRNPNLSSFLNSFKNVILEKENFKCEYSSKWIAKENDPMNDRKMEK